MSLLRTLSDSVSHAAEACRLARGDLPAAFVGRMARMARQAGAGVYAEYPREGRLLLALGGEGEGYFPYLALLPGGRVLARLLSLSWWDWRVPAAAHVLMERFEAASATVVFEVAEVGPDRHRCQAATVVRRVEDLTPDTSAAPSAGWPRTSSRPTACWRRTATSTRGGDDPRPCSEGLSRQKGGIVDPLTVLFLCGLAALASWRVRRRKRAIAAHPEAVRTGLDVLSRIVQSSRK